MVKCVRCEKKENKNMSFPYPGPIPPWTNPPIEPQFFQPGRFVISDVSFGITTIVTTVEDLTFKLGQLVRMIIPPEFGCRQLNEKTGYVLSFPASNKAEISINSSKDVTTFVNSSAKTKPQLLAIGDGNNGVINASGRTNNGTYIPGSFINTSPIGAP